MGNMTYHLQRGGPHEYEVILAVRKQREKSLYVQPAATQASPVPFVALTIS